VLSPTGSRVLDLSLAGFVVERGKGDVHGRAWPQSGQTAPREAPGGRTLTPGWDTVRMRDLTDAEKDIVGREIQTPGLEVTEILSITD
jgi:hypothetical protein